MDEKISRDKRKFKYRVVGVNKAREKLYFSIEFTREVYEALGYSVAANPSEGFQYQISTITLERILGRLGMTLYIEGEMDEEVSVSREK